MNLWSLGVKWKKDVSSETESKISPFRDYVCMQGCL